MATRHVTDGDSRSRAQQIVEQVVAEQDERLLAERGQRRAANRPPPSDAGTSDADERSPHTPDRRPVSVADGASADVFDDDAYLFGPPVEEPAAVAANEPRRTAPATTETAGAGSTASRTRVDALRGGSEGIGATFERVGRRLRSLLGEMRNSAFADTAAQRLRGAREYDYGRLAKTGADRVRRAAPTHPFDNQAVRWILVIIIGASLFGILLLLALDTMRGVLIL